nr:MAG TPA: hypothetical protein [Herelleviridae sp.]
MFLQIPPKNLSINTTTYGDGEDSEDVLSISFILVIYTYIGFICVLCIYRSKGKMNNIVIIPISI